MKINCEISWRHQF